MLPKRDVLHVFLVIKAFGWIYDELYVCFTGIRTRCKEREAAFERRYRSSRRCCNGGHGANHRSVSNTADTAGKTQRLTARLRRRVVMLTWDNSSMSRVDMLRGRFSSVSNRQTQEEKNCLSPIFMNLRLWLFFLKLKMCCYFKLCKETWTSVSCARLQL